MQGIIFQGPPGTGKTYMARAIAGEAGLTFFSAVGSEFVEMFAGEVGGLGALEFAGETGGGAGFRGWGLGFRVWSLGFRGSSPLSDT